MGNGFRRLAVGGTGLFGPPETRRPNMSRVKVQRSIAVDRSVEVWEFFNGGATSADIGGVRGSPKELPDLQAVVIEPGNLG